MIDFTEWSREELETSRDHYLAMAHGDKPLESSLMRIDCWNALRAVRKELKRREECKQE